jgi:anti-anti-sigma factor
MYLHSPLHHWGNSSVPGPLDTVFSLGKPLSTEALVAARARVEVALEAGAREIAFNIDEVGVLESKTIAVLISILRLVRERGGSVTLLASQPHILETLRITALDRVFAVASPESLPRPAALEAPKAPRSGAGRRFVAGLAGAVFMTAALLGHPIGAQSEMSVHDLLRAVAAQNPEMQSYQARVGIKVRLLSFPYVSEHLEGTTYFKRPYNFEVVLERVPSYAKGFDRLYADLADPAGWEQRFDVSIAGETNYDGHRDVVVRLVQKVRGMIDHEDVSIDPVNARIDNMEFRYYNGGFIAVSQDYQSVAGFAVLAGQHATIRIPYVHAAAEAEYTDYHTNVAIDDAVFTKVKQ